MTDPRLVALDKMLSGIQANVGLIKEFILATRAGFKDIDDDRAAQELLDGITGLMTAAQARTSSLRELIQKEEADGQDGQ